MFPAALRHRTSPCLTLWVTLMLAAGTAPVLAETTCPDTLAVRQSPEVPAGWTVSMSEQPPRLASVVLFDGQPANKVSLKPSRRQQGAGETRVTWQLPDTPRSIYLQCGYERTSAMISMPLPPGTSRCEVVFDRTTSYPSGASVIKRMVCR